MSEDRESFYYKLLEASVFTDTASLADLFEDDLLDNKAELSWILEQAIKSKDAKIVNFLLSCTGLEIDVVNASKQTALHLAVYHDYMEIVDRLFLHCRIASNLADVNGLTHFHVACIAGNLPIARRFLLGGVDANLRYQPLVPDANSHFGALHFAVKFAQTAVVELLLRHGADPNARDARDMTPLHLVYRGCGRGHDEVDIARLLLDHGADTNARDCRGDGPLVSLFRDGQIKLRSPADTKRKILRERRAIQKDKLALLLERGADPRVINEVAETPIHLVIGDLAFSRLLPDVHFEDEHNAEMVRLLLESGADPNAQNIKGESPLQMAIALLSYGTVRVLLDHGADAKCTKLYSGDENGFRYCPDLLPCLEATENLIRIVGALASTKFHLSPKDNLTILKFLVANNVKCRYADFEDENAFYKLQNLLELGASENIQRALNTFPVRVQDTTYSEQMMRKQVIIQIREHLATLIAGGIYVSDELRECLQLKIASLQNCLMSYLAEPLGQRRPGLEAELQLIKRTMIDDRVSLYDVVRANPRTAYSRIRNMDYHAVLHAADFAGSFPHCAGIIKGHVAKCLISRYVAESAREALDSLLDPRRLPDLCCEIILGYLSNESLLDLCVAATDLDLEVRIAAVKQEPISLVS